MLGVSFIFALKSAIKNCSMKDGSSKNVKGNKLVLDKEPEGLKIEISCVRHSRNRSVLQTVSLG